MSNNIRPSLVIAAGVTGAWALGSVVAGADEPPAGSLTTPDTATATSATIAAETDASKTDASKTNASKSNAPRIKGAEAIQGAKAARAAQAEAKAAAAEAAAAKASDMTTPSAPASAPTSAPITPGTNDVDHLFGPLSAFAPEVRQGPTNTQHTGTAVVGSAVDGVLPVADQAVTPGHARDLRHRA